MRDGLRQKLRPGVGIQEYDVAVGTAAGPNAMSHPGQRIREGRGGRHSVAAGALHQAVELKEPQEPRAEEVDGEDAHENAEGEPR